MGQSQRFRGMFGMALTWGVGLAALATGSLAFGLATGLVPSEFFGARELVAVAGRGLLAGGVAGALFGWLLARRERGHSLASLSTRRFAVWGFVATATIPTILALMATGPVPSLGVLVAGTVGLGSIGSLLGITTLGIARRATARLKGAAEELSRLSR